MQQFQYASINLAQIKNMRTLSHQYDNKSKKHAQNLKYLSNPLFNRNNYFHNIQVFFRKWKRENNSNCINRMQLNMLNIVKKTVTKAASSIW